MYETCAICGKLTDVLKDTPIDQRVGYMEGAGQLCKDCYQDILYPGKRVERENELLFDEALRMSRS